MDSSRQYMEATENNIELLRQMSHEFHMLFDEVMDTYGQTERKLRDDLLKFTEHIFQTIGIFAGFGFTGIQAVKNIYLFTIGEAVLIASILYGIAKIKNIHTLSLESVQQSFDRKFTVFNNKSKIFQLAIPALLEEKTLDINQLQSKIDKADKEIMNEFKEGPRVVRKNEGSFLNHIIYIAILGTALLLTSFIDISNLIVHTR